MIEEACVRKHIKRAGCKKNNNKQKKNGAQHSRAPLHLSFLSHLQITPALLTESKSKSNFPSWKWFSIDPHPELIGFMSCLRGNQITAECMCVRETVHIVSACVRARVHAHMCVCVCLGLFHRTDQWTIRWPSACNTAFLPPLIKVKRCNVQY